MCGEVRWQKAKVELEGVTVEWRAGGLKRKGNKVNVRKTKESRSITYGNSPSFPYRGGPGFRGSVDPMCDVEQREFLEEAIAASADRDWVVRVASAR